MTPTPLYRLERLSDDLGVEVWVKRDDLLGEACGGNKVRKNAAIFEQIPADTEVVVTCGGLMSNHCRVVALLAARRGIRCHVALHDAGEGSDASARIVQLTGATIDVGSPQTLGPRMAKAVQRMRADGLRVYVVPGGGHCLAGAQAYVGAAQEAQVQLGQRIDAVVLASGTGTTQAGLAVGFAGAAEVVGISVARPAARGGDAVAEAVRWLSDEPVPITFLDEWVGQGYGRPTPAGLAAISTLARIEGLLLDPTYTGKAMAALIDLTRSRRFDQGSSVVFWHTGGLLNLVQSPPS